MTVWVVYKDYDYDGCSSPIGVFSSFDLAKAYVNRNRYNKYERWEIESFVLDEG